MINPLTDKPTGRPGILYVRIKGKYTVALNKIDGSPAILRNEEHANEGILMILGKLVALCAAGRFPVEDLPMPKDFGYIPIDGSPDEPDIAITSETMDLINKLKGVKQ